MGRPAGNAPRVFAEPGLKKWPPAPKRLNEEERKRWDELGENAIASGSTRIVFPLVERLAQIGPVLNRELARTKIRASVIAQLSRIETTLMREAGLTPRGRMGLPKPPPPEDPGMARIRKLFGKFDDK